MEQRALLVLDEDEWLLITDDDDQEQVWQEEHTALAELKRHGWSIEVAPSILHAGVPGQPAKRVRGHVLRRSVH